MKSWFFTPPSGICIIIVLLLLGRLDAWASVPELYHSGTKRVLLIHSYNIWHVQSYNLLPGFLKVLSFSKEPYALEHLELDGQWDFDPLHWQQKLDQYLPALQAGRYQAVVTFNTLAAELLEKNLSTIHPNTPILLCALDQWNPALRIQHPNLTAILNRPEITDNIYLCLRLFPQAMKIILLLDHTVESREIYQNLPDINKLAPGAKLIPLNPSTISSAALLDYLSGLDQHSVVLYYGWVKQPEHTLPRQSDFFSEIFTATSVPILVMREALLPYGVVGGYVCGEEATGHRAAEILLSLLEGRSASVIPPETVENKVILNWPFLEKYQTPAYRIPPDASFRNRPPSFWISRQREIILVGSMMILFLLSLVLAALIFALRRLYLRRHETIFTHLPIRFFIADQDGNILNYELGNRELLDERKYVIQHIKDLHDIDLTELLEMIRKTLETGLPVTYNFAFRGSWRTMYLSKLPNHLYGRETVIWVSQNTTELQQSRGEAQASAERFLQTLKSIGDGVIVTDDSGLITVMNSVAAALTGWQEEESIGRPLPEIFNIVSYKDGKTISSPVEEVLRTRKVVELANHTDLISRTGERRHIADSAAPIFDANGAIIGTVLVFRDVTEQYQQREQKNLLEQEQKKLIDQLNNFVESQRILNRCLSQVVLEADFTRNVENIFSALSQQLKCDRISIGYFADDCQSFSFSHSWHAPEMQKEWETDSKTIRDFYPKVYALFEQDALLSIPDFQQCPYPELPPDLKLKSLLAAPIMVHGVVWGVLTFAFMKEQRQFSEIDENIIRTSCKIIAVAHIQNKQHMALRLAAQETRLILNNIQIPIWLYDADGNLLRVNTAVSRHFGIREILALEQAEDVLFDKSIPPSQRPLRQVIQTGKPASRETLVNHFDFLVTAEPVIDSNGKLINIVECAVNITDINEGRRQQELAMKAAQEADRTKSFFMATMSHEIRTPLNVVIGYSELLQQKKLSKKEQDEYLESIHYAGNALLQLINDILDLSKIDAGQMEIVPAKSDFVTLCRETCSLFRHQGDQQGNTIALDVSPMPFLFVDPLRLRQVLLNLMGNAVKFTRQGIITLSAAFTQENESAGSLEFSVTDTGSGISLEDQEKLFTPFVQLGESRASSGTNPGTGLGLAISNRLVKKMGGSLSLHSEVGRGSCFMVSIPNISYSSGQDELLHQAAVLNPAAEQYPLSFLIIDDVEMNLKVLTALLNKCDVEVSTATSGADALKILQQQSFDLILTDMWMPEMNGAEFAAKVKQLNNRQSIPIIAVTADIENHQNFKMNLFSGVILKPLTLKKIVSLVDAVRNQQFNQTNVSSETGSG
ncbi:MAG: ATP-binding protein [Lentisphaeria bacterium]